jgi:hypothetical protein
MTFTHVIYESHMHFRVCFTLCPCGHYIDGFKMYPMILSLLFFLFSLLTSGELYFQLGGKSNGVDCFFAAFCLVYGLHTRYHAWYHFDPIRAYLSQIMKALWYDLWMSSNASSLATSNLFFFLFRLDTLDNSLSFIFSLFFCIDSPSVLIIIYFGKKKKKKRKYFILILLVTFE